MHESNIPDNNPLEFAGSIEINNQQSRPVPGERIHAVIARILCDYQFTLGELSIAIVDDTTMHQLNRQYLQHDYPTDVLSFVLEQDLKTGLLCGEVIVSADTAESVAATLSHSGEDELLLYVVHGMLHLVGLKDKSKEDQIVMAEAETKYLKFLGIENVTSEAPTIDESAIQPGQSAKEGS